MTEKDRTIDGYTHMQSVANSSREEVYLLTLALFPRTHASQHLSCRVVTWLVQQRALAPALPEL